MNKQFIIWCFLLKTILCLEKFLQFIPHPDVTERKSVYELDQYPITIDAYRKSQILIKYLQYIPELNFPYIKFYCHVKPLDVDNKINNAYLCKKEFLSSKEDCHSVSSKTLQVKFGEIMTFETVYDASVGLTATLNMDITSVKTRKKPFDGFYYCKLNNLLGFIASNFIEIQDYEYYRKNLSSSIMPISNKFEPIAIKDITTNSFPIYLDCGRSVGNYEQTLPKWADKDLLSSFSWSLCPNGNSGIQCYYIIMDTRVKKSRALDDFMDYYQYPNGTVVLMRIRGNDYIKSGLVCNSRSIPSTLYSIYLVKNPPNWLPISFIQTGKYEKKIQQLSQKTVNVEIREGTYQSYRFKLYASYVANPDHTKVSADWKKNDYGVPPSFDAGPYQLTFPTEINELHMGMYTLKISQSEPYDSAVFTYNVTVVGAPKLKDAGKYSSTLYRLVDQSVNINVTFERNITKKSIEINGIQIDFSNEENKEKNLKDLSFQFPFLTGINISSNMNGKEDPGMIQYEASNLYKNKDTPQPKTHTVTLVAENKIGISKASYLIRVFEIPTFAKHLNSFNCSNNCKSDEKHEFKCSILETEYLSEGCVIQYLWTLNGLSLNSMNDRYIQKTYFQISNDTIILTPIKTDDVERDKKMILMLKSATLGCQVIIYEPDKTGRTPSTILYNTKNNPDLEPLLEATINLQANTVDSASASWILPLIISLIVLTVLVVLILYFCLRGSGETYNVDQKERAQGHDPEKEIRDNEVFQPYERDHESNLVQPSHLSFNDDDSVGVGSDDGELDVYDIDPGKFNEEGSFIGQYASDPRRIKSNNTKNA